MTSLISALATIVTLVVFVVDMVLWGVTRNHLRSDGAHAQYGNANWLTLGALVALGLSYCGASTLEKFAVSRPDRQVGGARVSTACIISL
jgi:hypothetical protein